VAAQRVDIIDVVRRVNRFGRLVETDRAADNAAAAARIPIATNYIEGFRT
jgi:hypothetical protein